jgi:hypothetical protein
MTSTFYMTLRDVSFLFMYAFFYVENKIKISMHCIQFRACQVHKLILGYALYSGFRLFVFCVGNNVQRIVWKGTSVYCCIALCMYTVDYKTNIKSIVLNMHTHRNILLTQWDICKVWFAFPYVLCTLNATNRERYTACWISLFFYTGNLQHCI